ncbi:MAG: molybdopterin converting factor subunit 1 [Rhodospirillales bacterium]|nr:molybdopterin converting factor subunit 1 [Rhodospirillales bacterium]
MRLLYFAWLRERLGRAEEEVTPPPSVETVADLMAWLGAREAGRTTAAFAEPGLIRAAVNQEFAGPGTRLAPGDEVAFFPPVTGG